MSMKRSHINMCMAAIFLKLTLQLYSCRVRLLQHYSRSTRPCMKCMFHEIFINHRQLYSINVFNAFFISSYFQFSQLERKWINNPSTDTVQNVSFMHQNVPKLPALCEIFCWAVRLSVCYDVHTQPSVRTTPITWLQRDCREDGKRPGKEDVTFRCWSGPTGGLWDLDLRGVQIQTPCGLIFQTNYRWYLLNSQKK